MIPAKMTFYGVIRERNMKTSAIRSWTLGGLILFLCVLSAGAGGDKTSGLNAKMAEISSLQQVLTEKISLAQDKRRLLKQKITTLREEIVDEKERRQINSYRQALDVPRIEFNLQLIQLLQGYVARLDERIRYFQTANETLSFYSQQIKDDLLLIKTLNDLEVDKLIASINSAFDEYVPQSRKPFFDVNDIPMQDMEGIWNKIASQ